MQKQPTVGPEWQSTSAKGASLAGFGLPMNHKTEFRDSDARFESSGTQAKLRNKFGDLWCNLLKKKVRVLAGETRVAAAHHSAGHLANADEKNDQERR